MGAKGQGLSGHAAAERLAQLSSSIMAQARVPDAGHGAHRYIFELLLQAIIENLRLNSDPTFTLTYDEWTLLANGRPTGKRTSRGNVLRFFNQWKGDLKNFTVAPGVVFTILTPGGRGSAKDPGRAGARVEFRGGLSAAESARTDLTIDSLLQRRREEEAVHSRLSKIHGDYLAEAAQAGGTKSLLDRLRRQFARIDAEVARRIVRTAAAFVLAVLVAGIGAQQAIAKYRRDLAELRLKAMQWMGMGAEARCVDGHPVVELGLSFHQEDAAPPFILLRNDVEVARFTERSADDRYQFKDTTVEGGRTYAYRVAREMYLTHERAYSRPWQVAVPRCREANRPPSVSAIRITPNPVRVGTPVRVSVVATDEEGDPLKYIWSFGSEYTEGTDSIQMRSFAKPGFVRVGVAVQDGYEGYVYREARLGVTDGKPRNRVPFIRTLLVAPEASRPGEFVSLIAVAGDPDGDELQYEWDPGGPQSGSGGSNEFAQYMYPASGKMMPKVTVSDSSLAKATASARVEVDATSPPDEGKCEGVQVSPAWLPSDPTGYGKGPVGTTFHFVPRSKGVGPSHVTWTFGDGSAVEHSVGTNEVSHRYDRAGIYITFAIMTIGRRKSACNVMVSVGEVPYTPQREMGLRGTVTPERGTTATSFQFHALAGPAIPGRQYRWTFTNRYTNEQIQSAWNPDPTYVKRFSTDGVWTVECEVQEPSGSRSVLKIGDAFVRSTP